jgi:Cysteine rich repeat
MRNPFALLAGGLLLATASSASVQALAEQLLEGCAREVETHCATVTAGEGRLLACLYAYGDKLSGPCELALYDTAVRLGRAISTLTYVANQCRTEIGSLCAGSQAGGGRVAQCLHDHAAELSGPCDRALAHVGLNE